MLLEIYILLIILAFISLFLGLKFGSFGAGSMYLENDTQPKYNTKLFLTTMFLLISIVLFFVLSVASYDIDVTNCYTIKTNETIQPDNVTTLFSNESSCNFVQYTDDAMGDFLLAFGWFSIILLVIYGFKEFSETFK